MSTGRAQRRRKNVKSLSDGEYEYSSGDEVEFEVHSASAPPCQSQQCGNRLIEGGKELAKAVKCERCKTRLAHERCFRRDCTKFRQVYYDCYNCNKRYEKINLRVTRWNILIILIVAWLPTAWYAMKMIVDYSGKEGRFSLWWGKDSYIPHPFALWSGSMVLFVIGIVLTIVLIIAVTLFHCCRFGFYKWYIIILRWFPLAGKLLDSRPNMPVRARKEQ